MPRAKRGFKARRRRNRVLKWAKGFRGKRKNCHAIANESVQHAWMHMYRSRKVRKRDFRSLWITRLTAAVKAHGLRYSSFIHGVQKAGITLNRKELSELAIHDRAAIDIPSLLAVPDDAPSLAESLKNAGYRTAAVVTPVGRLAGDPEGSAGALRLVAGLRQGPQPGVHHAAPGGRIGVRLGEVQRAAQHAVLRGLRRRPRGRVTVAIDRRRAPAVRPATSL